MSVELGSTNLTDIQNPVIGPQIEENFKGSTLDTIMSQLVKKTTSPSSITKVLDLNRIEPKTSVLQEQT